MRSIVFWALIGILLPVIFRRPLWGVVLYSALNIIRPEMLFWGGSLGARSLIIVIGATLLGTIFNSPNFSIKAIMRRELLLILWLYIALIVSIVLSQYEVPKAYYYANEIIKLFVLCSLLTILLDNYEKVIRYENALLLCIVLLGIWGIEQHFRGNVRLEGLGGQAWGDSNGVAAMFVLFFPLAFHKLFHSEDTKIKFIGFVSTVIIILLIIFTQSRGGLLGLIACSSVLILRSKYKMKIMIIAAFMAVIIFPFISQDYTSRMSTMESEETLDFSAKSRLILWQAGLKVFRDNPIFGTGFMSYPIAKMQYEDEFFDLDPDFRSGVFRTYNPKVAHNTYIQILSDGGLFAFIPYFLLIFGTFQKNRTVRKEYSLTGKNKNMLMMLLNIEAGIIGFCVCSIFMNSITAVFLPVQIVISLIIRDFITKATSEKTASIESMSCS